MTKKKQELDYLRKKCLLYNQFTIQRRIFPPQLQKLLLEVNDKIEEAYQRGDIRPLKAMSADIDEGIRGMEPQVLLQLEKIFKEHLNEDIAAITKRRLKSIEKVLKRGKINDDSEYELLMTRIDELCQQEGKELEIDELNELLLKY